MDINLGKEFLEELEAEASATRTCLERMKADLFDWQPHPRSMKMGYLALIVAEVPRWITEMTEKSEIDFGTFKHVEAVTPEELVAQFDTNLEHARKVLGTISNEALNEMCYLKNNGQTLMSATKKENARSCINHMVHHRGQLTVYLRLNEISVPSIYGPSADERTF
jgi:uncharacterized damage-inducible protein DinB